MTDEELNTEASEELGVVYGRSVITVPGAVLQRLRGARKQDIVILLEFLSAPAQKPAELAARLDCEPSAVEAALAFWRGAGILSYGEETAPAAEKTAEKPADKPADKPAQKPAELAAVPQYSSKEIADYTVAHPDVAVMIDECQTILGRVFSQSEIMRMVSVVTYFSLEPQYMMLACTHCAAMGQKSVGYTVKTVTGLCDRGITTVDVLQDYLFSIEKFASLETQIRSMCGMNMARELTTREKGYITDWSEKYNFGIDIIRLAYEITVDRIKEPSLGYMNTILSDWYTKDIKTAEQARALQKDSKKKSSGNKTFDSEDFFRAALIRSYGSEEAAPPVPRSSAPQTANYGVKPLK